MGPVNAETDSNPGVQKCALDSTFIMPFVQTYIHII